MERRRPGRGEDLADCYTNSLRIAKERGLEASPFPRSAPGVYGYPVAEAARIAFKTVKGFVEKEQWPPLVNFVLFSGPSLRAYEQVAVELGLA